MVGIGAGGTAVLVGCRGTGGAALASVISAAGVAVAAGHAPRERVARLLHKAAHQPWHAVGRVAAGVASSKRHGNVVLPAPFPHHVTLGILGLDLMTAMREDETEPLLESLRFHKFHGNFKQPPLSGKAG